MKTKLIALAAAMMMIANASAWTGEIFVSADPTKIKCTVPSMIVGTPEQVKSRLKELKACGVILPLSISLDDDGSKNTVKLKVRNFLRVK